MPLSAAAENERINTISALQIQSLFSLNSRHHVVEGWIGRHREGITVNNYIEYIPIRHLRNNL